MRTIGLLRGAPMKGPIQNKGRKKRISAWVVADLSTGLSIDGDCKRTARALTWHGCESMCVT